ncbi:dynein intermediate chain 3, ciliary-like [Diorhabda sublineata]|uniref:dynein intermediate chain 3, ciliary-like n=1 Tax=Diorhabda sublineata TaxID=1163346 RepID=UPI0024E0927A|nr:dynein intermediate chain 3, ciliary-like [Diorhabda sublineata]
MDICFQYQKKRSEFGRQCIFSDKGPDIIDNYPSNKKLSKEFISRDPVSRSQQCAPILSEHHLNTMRAEFANSGVNHFEGGWPKDINLADEEQTKRYRRKIEKDEQFYHVMMALFKNMEGCILQNNAVNIYQQYFSDIEQTPFVERSSARTVNVYQDQSTPTRPVTHISWSPDNQKKLAVSHCNLVFQSVVAKQANVSYIWEVENPNRPLYTLKPEQSIVCLEYNQKDPNILVSGQTNGQVALWDIRKSMEPVDMCARESSFIDPVLNVLWINSKTGTEFFSSSSDGQIKWWDTRKLSDPTDTLLLDYSKDEEQNLSNAIGASVLEYESTIPTRFMVGTEQGTVISGNRKGKTALEKIAQRIPNAHLGPVLALQRNPAFPKNFLTVGDWTAKIWSEDCRESCIMWTSFHKSALTDGAWSPTRLSVFFTTRSDGTLDVWDILQQQKQASLNIKICDVKLTRIKAHDHGKLLALGNQNGTVSLVELSENLSASVKNDKMLLTSMLDREARREKILEARNREIRLKQRQRQPCPKEDRDEGDGDDGDDAGFGKDSLVKAAEEEFYNTIEKEVAKTKDIEDQPEEVEKDQNIKDGINKISTTEEATNTH